MSKIILGESKIISIQHKSLIGTGSGDERAKSGLVGENFSQMSVSDKKIRTLERNRNISPAPFQVDSTDTDDEERGSDKFGLRCGKSSIQSETQNKVLGSTQIGSKHGSLNSQNSKNSTPLNQGFITTSHNSRTSVNDQEAGMPGIVQPVKTRSQSKEIRSAFSLTTGKFIDKTATMPTTASTVILPSLISSNGATGSNTINPSKSLQVLNTCQVTNKRRIAKVLGQTASNHSTSRSGITSTTTSSSQNAFSSTSSEENDKCQTKFTTRKSKIEPYNSLPEFATLPVQYARGYEQIQKPKPKYPDEYTERNIDRTVDRNVDRNVAGKHTNDSIYNFLTYESVDLKWKYQRYLGQQNITESVKNQNHKGLISQGVEAAGMDPQGFKPKVVNIDHTKQHRNSVNMNSPTNSNNFENKYFDSVNKNFENNVGKPKHQPDQTHRQQVKPTRSNNSSGSNSSSSWENYTFLYPGTKPQNYTQHARKQVNASRQSTITFGESKMLQDCFSKLTCRNNVSVQGPISVSIVREMENKTPENSYGTNVKVYDLAVGKEQSQNHVKNRQFQFNSEEMHHPPQPDYKTPYGVSSQNFLPPPPPLTRSVKNSSPTPSNRLSELTRNNNNYPVHRLPSVVERFMQESLQSSDFRECKVKNEPSLLDQHMAAIGMDEFEQFFDRDQAKRETHNIYRKDIYKNRKNCEEWAKIAKKELNEKEKDLENRCEIDNTCSSDSDSMMVRECKHENKMNDEKIDKIVGDKTNLQHELKVDVKVSSKALESRSRQPSPISSDYSEKSEVGSRDLALLAQWSEEYGEHIATKMLGTLMTMRENNELTGKPVC